MTRSTEAARRRYMRATDREKVERCWREREANMERLSRDPAVASAARDIEAEDRLRDESERADGRCDADD